MATLTALKIAQPSGAPSLGKQAMVSTTWGIDGSDLLNNGVISLPKIAGTTTHLLRQNAAGVWGYVDPAGVDITAIHDNVASEISAITVKGTPAGADFILIEDSAAANIKKHVLISSLPFAATSHTHVEADITDLDHTDADAIHDNVASEISAITVKGSPVGGDFLVIEDSAAGNVKKHILISSLPTGGTPGGIDTQVQYNNGSVFGGMTAMTYNDATQKILLNADGVTGGDVEIRTFNTGTTLFAKVSTGKVGIGLNNPTSTLHVDSPTGIPMLVSGTESSKFEGTSSSATATLGVMTFRAVTSVSMTDPFGVQMNFEIEDDTSGPKIIGLIRTARDGADDKGKLTFFTGVGAGSILAGLTIDSQSFVGIGTTEPEHKLHIVTGTGAGAFTSGSPDDLVIEGSDGVVGMTLASTDANFTYLAFGSPSRAIGANCFWSHTALEFVVGTATSGAKLSLATGGQVRVIELDTNGKTTINIGSLAAADFQVNWDTGVSIFADATDGRVGINTASPSNTLDVAGGIDISVTGKGLGIKEGVATDSVGSATLVAGAVTVSNTNIATGDIIMLTRFTIGGTVGNMSYTISNGTSFTINSDSGSDTSVVNYMIIRTL